MVDPKNQAFITKSTKRKNTNNILRPFRTRRMLFDVVREHDFREALLDTKTNMCFILFH